MKKKSFLNWQEARRLRGIYLHRKGWKQKEIADVLGVSKMAVSQWIKKFKMEGKKSLKAKIKPGAPSRLSEEKRYQVLELLYPGAEAWGFIGDIWTCARIGNVIERKFGVSYHRHHIAKIMKALDWSSHKLKVRASQRNEKIIKAWKKNAWPYIKKSQKREKDHISTR